MSTTQVVVADDDVLLREGLASLLDRSGFEVVGQASDATELLALVRDRKPQLVVVDIRMPPTHSTEGLDAAHVIRAELPDTGILVLSASVVVTQFLETFREFPPRQKAATFTIDQAVAKLGAALTEGQ